MIGPSSSIGLATARAFTQAGTSVALIDVEDAAIKKAGGESNDAGQRTIAVACDWSDEV